MRTVSKLFVEPKTLEMQSCLPYSKNLISIFKLRSFADWQKSCPGKDIENENELFKRRRRQIEKNSRMRSASPAQNNFIKMECMIENEKTRIYSAKRGELSDDYLEECGDFNKVQRGG